MRDVKITVQFPGQGDSDTLVGFKLIEPDGITLFYDHGTLTLPRKEVNLTVEVEE